MTEIYFPKDHTADEWRAQAAASVRAEQESWERSDTDGFLSQWASGQSARMYRHLADLAEKGGVDELDWPFLLKDGEWVPAAEGSWGYGQGQYGGYYWIGAAKNGLDKTIYWNPSHAAKGAQRQARDEAKGVRRGTIRAEVVSMFKGAKGSYTLSIHDEPRHGAEIEVVTSLDGYDWDRARDGSRKFHAVA